MAAIYVVRYRKVVLHASVWIVLLVFGADRLHAQKIYWTDSVAGKIQRANLDGSNIEEIVSGLSTAVYITLDIPVIDPPVPAVSTWGLIVMSCCWLRLVQW